MKTQINAKIARIGLILGGSCCLFISSCAMSEGRSKKIGEGVGTAGGAVIGAAAVKKNGGSTGQAIFGGIVGAEAGRSLGGFFGKRASTLKGIEHVKR